ncbi:MAG: tetratricopeptide repeat protein, partial [Gammaproteobacteria bacterium]|nr:tetratricopeptide repeat protein [Gammaproteobacteria bacterium]
MNRNPERALRDELLSHLARGDIRRAGPTAERLVERYPDYASGRSAFSELWLRCGRPDLACEQAERAYRLSPDSPEIVAQYAKCLVFDGAYRPAEQMAETALSLEPDDHTTLDTIGNVLSRAGRQERALAVFQRALAAAPDNTTALYNLATSLRFFGRIEEAEALFEKILEIDPDDFQALHSRSILKRQTASSNHVAELEQRLASDPPWPASSHVGYALGKELDDIGRPRDA